MKSTQKKPSSAAMAWANDTLASAVVPGLATVVTSAAATTMMERSEGILTEAEAIDRVTALQCAVATMALHLPALAQWLADQGASFTGIMASAATIYPSN